jgi:hypothetical protein
MLMLILSSVRKSIHLPIARSGLSPHGPRLGSRLVIHVPHGRDPGTGRQDGNQSADHGKGGQDKASSSWMIPRGTGHLGPHLAANAVSYKYKKIHTANRDVLLGAVRLSAQSGHQLSPGTTPHGPRLGARLIVILIRVATTRMVFMDEYHPQSRDPGTGR